MGLEYRLDRLGLDPVVERRRSAMGVYVVDVPGVEARVPKCLTHRQHGAGAVLGWRGDLVRIGRRAITEHLGVDGRATSACVFEGLENDQRGSFAHYAPIAVEVEGLARGGSVLVARTDRVEGTERGEFCGVQHRVGATSDHDIGVVPRDDPESLTD